jgi:hypothetical protein
MLSLRLRRLVRTAIAAALSGAMAAAACAAPITYTISGIASGTQAGIAFTNAAFIMTAVGDDASVISLAPGVPCNDFATVAFTISGVDSGYVTSPLSIAVNTGRQLLAIALGRCAEEGQIWISGYSAQFTAYRLRDGIGPVTVETPSSQSAEHPVTTGGILSINSIVTMTFQSTPGATFVPAVGLWWNPNESGSGYNLDVKHGILVVTIYSYTPEGQPQWYITSGPIVDGSFEGTINKYTAGQCISCFYNGLPVTAGNDGVIGIEFSSPTSARMLLPGGRVTYIQPQAF